MSLAETEPKKPLRQNTFVVEDKNRGGLQKEQKTNGKDRTAAAAAPTRPTTNANIRHANKWAPVTGMRSANITSKTGSGLGRNMNLDEGKWDYVRTTPLSLHGLSSYVDVPALH